MDTEKNTADNSEVEFVSPQELTEITPKTISIMNNISPEDPSTILTFGKEATDEISKFSDKILKSFQQDLSGESGQLLLKLNSIMKNFDKGDFVTVKEKGLLEKLFGKKDDNLLEKYNSVGSEIDKVFVQIKKYENEISESNTLLDTMYENNMTFYDVIDEYILAGKTFIENFKQETIPQLESDFNETQSQLAQIKLNNANQLLEMLDQRIYDLELAKLVAIQTAPQIKLIQNGNYDLIRKINSSFVITLPIFKQSIIQAVTMKRQKVQADALVALDNSTNEMLRKNAQNVIAQSKFTQQLASESSVKIEVLEDTWNTIITGIQEVKALQTENQAKRIESINKLKNLQESFHSTVKQINEPAQKETSQNK